MQCSGYMVINGDRVKVLARQGKLGRYFKIRKTGRYGAHFIDEQNFLAINEYAKKQFLKTGKIYL